MAVTVLGLAPAEASSANISHSYSSEGSIKNGSLVSLDPRRSDYVQAATSSNGQRLLGIAVASDDSLLAIDPMAGAVQVATSGTANGLVSTLNGDIAVGDQVSVSPFEGVGMKATPGSRVIGLAQTSFNIQTSGARVQQVTDKKGKVSQVQVGFVRLGIAPGRAASAAADNLNSLQRYAKNLGGHTISTARVVLSLIIALVALTSIITLMYSSVYASIISIGRNPLAKYAVFRSLTSVLGMAALTAVVAGSTIFLLLR